MYYVGSTKEIKRSIRSKQENNKDYILKLLNLNVVSYQMKQEQVPHGYTNIKRLSNMKNNMR